MILSINSPDAMTLDRSGTIRVQLTLVANAPNSSFAIACDPDRRSASSQVEMNIQGPNIGGRAPGKTKFEETRSAGLGCRKTWRRDLRDGGHRDWPLNQRPHLTTKHPPLPPPLLT